MLSFFLSLILLGRTLRNGLRSDPEFRALAVLLALLLLAGTMFYWRVERWSVVDSLYFCVMTIATIGYGDLVPTTPLAKIFTIGLALLGIGMFATFVGKMVALMIQQRTTLRHPRQAAAGSSPGSDPEPKSVSS
ncbi:two pore domain potassium channel family protein [bacterium]|nr:two pore domain potassium channel family protein [bacterium]